MLASSLRLKWPQPSNALCTAVAPSAETYSSSRSIIETCTECLSRSSSGTSSASASLAVASLSMRRETGIRKPSGPNSFAIGLISALPSVSITEIPRRSKWRSVNSATRSTRIRSERPSTVTILLDVNGSNLSRTHQRTIVRSSSLRKSRFDCTASPPARITTTSETSNAPTMSDECVAITF